MACAGKEEACPVCKGTGRQGLTRCPWVMVGQRERFVCQVASWVEAGVLPYAEVGWSDLPMSLVLAVNLVSAERADIDRKPRGGN